MSNTKIFVDISALLGYVETYSNEHTETQGVIREANAEIVISEFAAKKKRNFINNRIRMFDIIYREISKLDCFPSEKDKIDHICEDILTYEFLNESAPLGVDEFLHDSLQDLRDRLREDGVDLFLTKLEAMDGNVDLKREELCRKIIDDRIEIGSSHKKLEECIDSTIQNPPQSQNLIKGAYWNQDTGEGFILVKHNCKAYKNKEDIRDVIEDYLMAAPAIYSPVFISEKHEVA